MNLTLFSQTTINKNVDVPSKSGIYLIRNLINGKVYIGQTINIKQRIRQHINKFKRGKHYNSYFQASMDKYGMHNFELLVLELCERENLSNLESKYIKQYKSYKKDKGYNMTLDCNTHIYSTRKIIGSKNRELLIKNNINKTANARRVNQYSLNGEFIKTWKSSKEVNQKLGISIGNLNSYLNDFKPTKSLKKFMWKWYENTTENLDISYYKKRNTKKILAYNNDFYKEYLQIKDVVNDLKISRDTISTIIKGTKLEYKGFKFKYL